MTARYLALMTATAALALLLATPLPIAPPELPALAELERFASLEACNARIRALIDERFPEYDAAFRLNAYRLECWTLLHEARGGLEEEKGGRGTARPRGELRRGGCGSCSGRRGGGRGGCREF
ncbi:hypothetical protein AYO40_01675 [Planctomycetaceae bacterium SCGC AG-212-D15]|nr:hypothetical protein AYO40_01675 [Planctomycetaceae bacterium SCGC AG-212-D15]